MKQFKLPFMGNRLTIKVLPPESMSDSDLWGECLSDSYEIHISTAVPQASRRAVLSHELFHAFLSYSGYKEIVEAIHPACHEAMTLAFEHSIGNMVYYPDKIEEWLTGP